MAYSGTVKSKGEAYGFIKCDATHAVYGRDVFIQQMNLTATLWSQLQQGQGVSFDVTLDAKGQPQAMNLTITHMPDPAALKGDKGGKKGKGWEKGGKKGWEDPSGGYGGWQMGGGDGGYGGYGGYGGPGAFARPEWIRLPPEAQMVSLQGETGYFISLASIQAQMASGPYGMGGGGKKRPASEMDGGKGDKGWGKMNKFPKPEVPNPGLDPEQQTFAGIMKGRLNPSTGYSFISCDEVAVMYPGKDVFVHSKMCPWVETMELEKDMKVQFQYVEKDGAPQCTRIIIVDGTTPATTAGAFTSFSAPMTAAAF